jgi:DNA replication and repair protein RecF
LRVESLILRAFRNYEEMEFAPAPGLCVLVGPNGAGKTNILEAMVVLSLTRSNRAFRDEEMARLAGDSYYLGAHLSRPQGHTRLEIAWERGRRRQFKVNGLAQPGPSSYVGRFLAVFFGPDEMMIAKGPPAQRRRYLDVIMAQISSSYLHLLGRYKRIIDQKNRLLRSPQGHAADADHLQAWNDQLVEVGAAIMERRARACLRLGVLAAQHHAGIAGASETLRLVYRPAGMKAHSGLSGSRLGPLPDGPLPDANRFREILLGELDRLGTAEVARSASLVGPHRDDLLLALDGGDLRAYGSQGQMRTAALALKFAEVSYMEEETDDRPVMLLDDVLSELDADRRSALATLLGGGRQSFLTVTDGAFLPSSAAEHATYYTVAEGRVLPARTG